MKVHQFSHYSLPSYTFIEDSESNLVYLSSRNSDDRLMIDKDTLQTILKSITKVYPTISKNLRLKQVNDYEFYHTYSLDNQVFIRKVADETFINIYLCDLERILNELI